MHKKIDKGGFEKIAFGYLNTSFVMTKMPRCLGELFVHIININIIVLNLIKLIQVIYSYDNDPPMPFWGF